jgi:large subunit ribosomal protein L10
MTQRKANQESKAVQEKMQEVKDTLSAMKKYKTTILIDLRQLPDSLLQSIRKKLRQEGGQVFVLRKPVISRVLAADKNLANYATECDKPVALICTDKSPYEMNAFFKDFKKKKAAKTGDVASTAIVVPEGDTDLPPGPALSELKAAGLNVQIKGGKIAIVKESTVAKSGEKLTVQKVKALQTLGIKPFEVMAKFIMGCDGRYVYSKALLDSAETVREDLGSCFAQAMNVSLNANYPTKMNIDLLVTNAMKQARNVALNGSLYSSDSVEQLLVSAMRQGSALTSLEKS